MTHLEGNVDNLETRLARLLGEYTVNMASLGQRLQVVERLAEQRKEAMDEDKRNRANTLDVTGLGTSEDDV